MARKIGKKNVVKAEYCNYAKLINGVAGIGKTTLFFDIVNKLYGENGGIMITIGEEPEPIHIPNAVYERVEEWDDFVEVVEILCDERTTEYAEVKEIGIDSADEIFRLAERKVIQMHNRKFPDKKVDSVKQCFGGFQAGEDKVVDIVTETIFKLRTHGYGLTIIGHTKTKGKKDELTDVEYELLTSNLPAKYYNALKDKVNLVGTSYVEREYADLTTARDAFTKGEDMKGRIVSEKRVISFRDEEHAIDVKSHFPDIVAKCDFNAESVIKAITDAINSQLAKQFGSNVNVEEVKKQQAVEAFEKANENIREARLQQIKEAFPKLDTEKKSKIAEIIKNGGGAKLDDASDKDIELIVALIG